MPPSKQDLHVGRLTFCDLEETRLRFVLVRSASLNHEVSDPTRGFLTLPNHKRSSRSRGTALVPCARGLQTLRMRFGPCERAAYDIKSRRIETKRTISRNHPKLIRGRKEPDLGIAQI